MNEVEAYKLTSIVQYSDNFNLFKKSITNIAKQTLFKTKQMQILVITPNEISNDKANQLINIINNGNIKLVFKEFNSANDLLQILSDSTSNYIFFCPEDVSLRPDALELLVEYADFQNSELTFSDEIITLSQDETFENTNSKIATCFPREIHIYLKEPKSLPKCIIYRKSALIRSLTENFGQDINRSFKTTIFEYIKRNLPNIEKLEQILALHYLDLNTISNDEVTINEFQTIEFLKKYYGHSFFQRLDEEKILSLPYHFANPNFELISFIVILHNEDSNQKKEATINSIKEQDYPQIEIVCSNTISSCGEEPFVRNILTDTSSGKYLVFLHPETIFNPDFCRKCIDKFKKSKEIAFIYSDYITFAEGSIVETIEFEKHKLLRYNFIPCVYLISKKDLISAGGFEESLPIFYSNWDLFLTLVENEKIGARVAEILYSTEIWADLQPKDFAEDIISKSKIILRHLRLFTQKQLDWAESITLSQEYEQFRSIPIGIIPNDKLLEKITPKIVSNTKKRLDVKKILFVMYGWRESGGGTTYPRSVALELSRRGYDVTVFYASLRYDANFPPYSIERGSDGNVKLIGLFNRPAAFNDPANPEREINDPKIEEIFNQVLEEVQPDIIHFHNLHGLTLVLPKIAKEFSIPTVFTPHNFYLIDPLLYLIKTDGSVWNDFDFFSSSDLPRKYPEKIEFYRQREEVSKQILNEWIDLTLAVSTFQKKVLSEFASQAKNIIVVHQCPKIVDELWQNPELELEAQRKISGKMRFGYVGGVYYWKGVHNFVKAAQYFLPQDVEFHIFGSGDSKYIETLKAYDKKKIVNFHGSYNHQDLFKIARGIDVAVFLSVWYESAGLVSLENNAMRLPVIASNIGGIPDFVVNGVNGFLCDYDSIDSLVASLQYCSLNPEKIEIMRSNLFQIHSFENYINHLIKIYDKLTRKEIFDPTSLELIVTNKLLKQEQVDNYVFTVQLKSKEHIQAILERFGFIVDKIENTSETKDYSTYSIEIRVPKELQLEEFFEETAKNQTTEPEITLEGEQKGFEIEDLVSLANKESEQKDEYKPEFVEFEKEEAKICQKPELNVVWEGSQFVYHSLALINREHCSNLIDTGCVEVTIIPYEVDQFQPQGNTKYEKLQKHDIRWKADVSVEIKKLPYVWVRHQWPPKKEPPKGAKWIIIQPWEFSSLPVRFVEIFSQADEIWVPSNFTRNAFVQSGLDFNKVQIIPNGIDPELFQPNGRVFTLNTKKRLKFLYVGGTTFRKGFDILLESYIKTFTAQDDVCLVVKDMGTESFYKGQTAEDKINAIRNTPNTPEIIYFKNYFTEEEMASLYRACDVFVAPYRGEGFSLPTLEAMACGLPVVVTQGGSTEDFVHDSFGWKIPSYKISIGKQLNEDILVNEAFLLEPDSDALSKILRAIYANPSEIAMRGVLASSYARQFWTWKRSTLKLLSRLDYLYGKKLAQNAKSKLIDNTDNQILIGIAEKHFSNGEIRTAKTIFESCLKNFDELNLKYKHFVLLRLAIVEFLEHNLESSKKYIEQFANLGVYTIDTLYLKAKIALQEGKLIDALNLYSELVTRWNKERFESLLGNSLDIFLVDMGNIMIEMNDFDSAYQLFTEAIKLNSENSFAHLGAAKCYLRLKDITEAKRLLNWALKVDPDNSEAKELLAELEKNQE